MQRELEDVSSKSPVHSGPARQAVARPSSPAHSAFSQGGSSWVNGLLVDPYAASHSDRHDAHDHGEVSSSSGHRLQESEQQHQQGAQPSSPKQPPPAWLLPPRLGRKYGPITKEEHAQQEAKIAAWIEQGRPSAMPGRPPAPGGRRSRERLAEPARIEKGLGPYVRKPWKKRKGQLSRRDLGRRGYPTNSGSTGSTDRLLRGADIALAMQRELEDVSSKSPAHPGSVKQGVARPSSPPHSASSGGSTSWVDHLLVDPYASTASSHHESHSHGEVSSALDHQHHASGQQQQQHQPQGPPPSSSEQSPPPWLMRTRLGRKLGPLTKQEHAKQQAKIAAWIEQGRPSAMPGRPPAPGGRRSREKLAEPARREKGLKPYWRRPTKQRPGR